MRFDLYESEELQKPPKHFAAITSATGGRKDSPWERIWVQRRHETSTTLTIPRAFNPNLRTGRRSSSDITCDSVAGLRTITSVTMLCTASFTSAVQCHCSSVARLFTISSSTFQNYFTPFYPTFARLFASCLWASTRISLVLKHIARIIVISTIQSIYIVAACVTVHPKAWKKRKYC